jgi:uncharacterized membrane protein
MKQVPVLLFASVLISFSALSAGVGAVGLELYGIEDVIKEDLTVHNKIVLRFDAPIRHLDYQLDFNVFNFTAEADFVSADCELSGDDRSLISCDFIGMTEENNKLVMEFDMKDIIKERNGELQFNVNYGVSLPIERSFTLIQLPENGILARQTANESFFPRDGDVITDGRHIIVFWESHNLTSGDNLQYSISFVPRGERNVVFNVLVIAVTIIVIAAIVGIGLYVRRGTKTKEIVAPLLREDEKIIVNILNKNNGSCIQRVLVKESNFSKAKVSRLVKGLSERNVVAVERMGRTTKVKLKLKGTES